jgi:hypothetical protein
VAIIASVAAAIVVVVIGAVFLIENRDRLKRLVPSSSYSPEVDRGKL